MRPCKCPPQTPRAIGDTVRVFVGLSGQDPVGSISKVTFSGAQNNVEALRFNDGTLEFPSDACSQFDFRSIDQLRDGSLPKFARITSRCIPNIVVQIPQGATSGSIVLEDKSGKRFTVKEPIKILATPSQAITCGDTTSCYDNADAKQSGIVKLPSGKEITLVQGAGFFQVWKEKNGNRILSATGLEKDGWQKKLRPGGRVFNQEFFTNWGVLAGRTCANRSNMASYGSTLNDSCVYFSKESENPISFWEPGESSGTEGVDFFGEWKESVWYHGNISQCSSLGMRLPILPEIAGNQIYFGDRSPGIPKEILQRPFVPGAISSKKFLLTASVFDPPRSSPIFGPVCSLNELNDPKNELCAGGSYPNKIQFNEPFASSSRAHSMYWIAAPKEGIGRATPYFYFPDKNAQSFLPVHTVCILPAFN